CTLSPSGFWSGGSSSIGAGGAFGTTGLAVGYSTVVAYASCTGPRASTSTPGLGSSAKAGAANRASAAAGNRRRRRDLMGGTSGGGDRGRCRPTASDARSGAPCAGYGDSLKPR